MPNPLAAFVASVQQPHPRAELRRRFEEMGWKCSDALIYLWCTDRRWPTLESQARIEAVTGGKVSPSDWMRYGIERVRSGAKKPAPYGQRKAKKKTARAPRRRRKAG